MSLRSPEEHKNGWHSRNMISSALSFPTAGIQVCLRRLA